LICHDRHAAGTLRPPLVKIERSEIMRIRQGLIEAGLLDKNARDAA
jgi:hypothetical protein